MADDRTVEVGIGFKATDKSGVDLIKQTADSLDKARTSVEAANKAGGLKKVIASGQVEEIERITGAAAKTAQEILDVQNALEGLSQTDPGFDEKTKQLAALNDQLRELNTQAAKTPAILDSAGGSRVGTFAGKEAASQIVGGIGGLAANVSPGAGQTAQVLQQLLQVGDGFKKLSSTLVEVPGVIGGVAAGAAALAAPLGTFAAGLAAILAIALPVALAVGGLALVVSHLNDKAKEGEQNAQKYIDALDGQIKVDREIANYLKSGDFDGAKKRYKELLDAQTDANSQLTYLYQQKADIDKKYADAQRNLNLDQLASLGSEGGKIKDEIDRVYKEQFLPAKQAVDEFGKSIGDVYAAGQDKNQLDAQIKAIQDRANIETQLNDIIRQGNSGAISQRRQALEDELTNTENSITALKNLGTQNDDTAAAIQSAEAHTQELRTQIDLYSPAAEEAAKAQAALNTQTQDTINSYVQQIQTAQQVAGFLKSANTQQLNDRLDSLNTEKDAINAQLPNIQALAKTSTDAAQKAKDYESRLKAINNEFSQLSAARPEVRAAEVQKAQDELAAAETASDRRIADIRQSGLQKLADIEQKYTDGRSEALAKENDTIAKANATERKAVSDVDKDYMKNELKAWSTFRDDVAKQEDKNKKERLRLIDDTNQALIDAEKANDVIAFIAAAQKGQDQLKQFDENAKDQEDERQAQFLAERQQAKEQHDERIVQIKEQAQETRDEAAKQYDLDLQTAKKAHDEAVKAQQDQQEQLIAAEEAGLLQRVTQIQDTYHLEDSIIQDMFSRRKARYGEDDKIINDRLDLELARHAEDVKTKANAEIAENARAVKLKSDAEIKAGQAVASVMGQNFGQTITVIQTGLSSLVSAIKAQLSQSGTLGGSGKPAPRTTGSGGGGLGISGRAFANEGIVTAADGATIALLGEDLAPGQIEAVVKFKPSEGLPKNLTGGGSQMVINLNGDIDLGGISRDEFMTGLHELGAEIVLGVQDARSPTK